jgi:hypothetical protein
LKGNRTLMPKKKREEIMMRSSSFSEHFFQLYLGRNDDDVCFIYCSQTLKLFGFPIFRYWVYLMKVIPETCVRTKFDITNKTDCHDITLILLKVVLNTITLTLLKPKKSHWYFLFLL